MNRQARRAGRSPRRRWPRACRPRASRRSGRRPPSIRAARSTSASFSDGITDTVAAASSAGTSCRRPVKITRSVNPSRVGQRFQAVLVVLLGGIGVADDDEPRVRETGRERCARPRETARALSGASAATPPSPSARLRAMPSSRRTRSGSGRSVKRSSSTPFGMTTIFAGSYPSLVSQSLTASAFTSTQSAKRQTNRCTRFCIGVRYAAAIANRRNHDRRRRQPRRQNAEDVAVEAVGVHHVDALLRHVARELRLLRERREAVEAGNADTRTAGCRGR